MSWVLGLRQELWQNGRILTRIVARVARNCGSETQFVLQPQYLCFHLHWHPTSFVG